MAKFQSIIGYLIFTLFLNIRIAKSYQIQDESEPETFCLYKQHFTITPNLTCCNNSVVKPGINLLDYWDACTSESPIASSIHEAAWKIYGCIIQSSNGDKSEIDLAQFANLMMDQYPKAIQSQILKEVASVGIRSAVSSDVSEIDKLDKIRRTYFDIERQVCSNSESSNETNAAIPTRNYGKDDGNCQSLDEDLHRGGRCCGMYYLPFEIYFPLFTLPKTDQCLHQLQSTVFPKLSNFSLAMQNSIAEICSVTCDLMERNVVGADMFLFKDGDDNLFDDGLDFESIARELVPNWVPSEVKDDAVVYTMENFVLNNTIERITTLEFVDVHETWYGDRAELEYVTTQRFPTTAAHIPVICSSHSELQAFIEHFLYTKGCGDAGSDSE